MQKHFSAPSVAGNQPLISDSPWSQRSPRGSMKAEIDDAVPVRRWQRVQWQYPAENGGAVSSKRTAPHRQPP